MPLDEKAQLLRVFIGESDRHGGKPLYEAIVLAARHRGMAGATVLKGMMGYGHSSRLHTASVLRLSEDLPVVVEIVDRPDRIEAFLPELSEVVDGGLITVEEVRVVRYGKEAT
jgi:PII-like signaling protein